MNYEKISIIVMSVGIMSMFIIIFFFTYAKNIEEEMVSNEIKRLVDSEIFLIRILPDNMLNKIKTDIEKLLDNVNNDLNIKKKDDIVNENNEKIINTALKTFFPLGFLLVIISLGILSISTKNYTNVLKINMYTLIIIAFVEVMFVKYLAGLYKPLDINETNRTIINNIELNEELINNIKQLYNIANKNIFTGSNIKKEEVLNKMNTLYNNNITTIKKEDVLNKINTLYNKNMETDYNIQKENILNTLYYKNMAQHTNI